MKIAIITSNLSGIASNFKVPRQNIEVDYFYYNEKNLPMPLVNLSNRLKHKYLKMQTHRFLPNYDLYIWLDSNVKVNSNNFAEHFVNKIGDADACFYKHSIRKNVYEEIFHINNEANNGNKYFLSVDNNESLIKESLFYKESDVTEHDQLFNCAVFIRRNNTKANITFDIWWNRYIEFCNFDQAMFTYAAKATRLNIKSLEFEEVRTDKLFKREITVNYEKENQLVNKNEFLRIVKDALKNEIPFAFVRYSDGEIMLFNNEEYYNEYINIIKKLWGYEPSKLELNELHTHLGNSILNADIVGFPTPRHLARADYFNKAEEVFKKCMGAGVLESKTLSSIDVCYELLYDDRYSELLQGLDTLNYVSCRNIDQELKAKYNIKNINSFIIAPEPKFTSGYEGERHYPDQFNKIKEWIKTVDCKGNLCLVGGGVMSKIYNIWFKERGGVSLDIGAVFDLWAGKKTRGVGRGLDVEFNDYKI